MAEILFSGPEADELLDFIEGEGSCVLVHDAAFRLYELLCERAGGEPCAWSLETGEAAELVDEVDDCAETAWSTASSLLAARLRGIVDGPAAPGAAPNGGP